MSNQFEDFVKNNREDFDKFEPGPVVWHNIQQDLKRPAEKKGILISMNVLRWAAAAAVLLIIGTGTYYFLNKKNTATEIVKKEELKTNDLPVVTPKIEEKKETPVVAETIKPQTKTTEPKKTQTTSNDDENQELIYYTKLVELKQNQITKIKNDEPLLYKQFAGDFNRLDSTFHILKKQLPVNPNREQILEAMIQNLQYQEALLNQQLNVIKKLKNSKKEAYEKAYKSA
ncbi:MAG TPA: hypothetical protein VKI61_07315 [Chitinophagaceae bacterium]|jgi:hypothetical protein|nr:hypothetical protein [Chitinophagaceae bacterium]